MDRSLRRLVNRVVFQLLLSLSLLSTSVISIGRDVTLEDKATGASVVEAAIRKLQFSEIFINQDAGFLRRIAYAESRDGALPETFTTADRRGIWRIDQTRFIQSKDGNSIGLVTARFLKIKEKFGIDWLNVTFDDLNKPFYGALAAQLIVARQENRLVVPDAEAQALVWYQLFRGGGTTIDSKAADKFIAAADEIDAKVTVCDVPSMDLVFVIESDDEEDDFRIILTFLHSTVDYFDIADSKVRVAVVLSSERKTRTVIPLVPTLNKTSLIEAIAVIESSGFRDVRQAGITEMLDNTLHHARPSADGVPRVAVIVAVGNVMPSDNVTAAVSRARTANVRLFAVAVNSDDPKVLRSVASYPNKYHLFSVNPHFNLVTYADPLRRLVCSASTLLNANQHVMKSQLQQGQRRFIEFQLTRLNCSALKVDVSQGDVLIYASMQYPNPSEVLYDQKATAKAGKSVIIYPTKLLPAGGSRAANSSEPWHGYMTVQAVSDRVSFTVDFSDGTSDNNVVCAAAQRFSFHVAGILCLVWSMLAVL